MAAIWLGCALVPSENLRQYGYMLAVLWPVLVWSKMGRTLKTITRPAS